MAVSLVGLVFFLALAGYSDANYCICNSGLSDSVLQKNIDYACGAGADCSAILQNGPCFNPNTVKDHCSYAVNSYYQRKGNAVGSCDFQGTATVVPNLPNASSGCVYPSGPSNAGGTTPSTSPPTGGTPTTPMTPNTGGTPTSPGTFPGGSTTNPGTVPGSPLTPGFNLAPSGSGFSNTDSSSTGLKQLSQSSSTFMLVSMIAIILISSSICPMI